MPKPNKKLYENQTIVKGFVLDKILDDFSRFKEVYLTGSLVTASFGIYDKPWKDHGGQIHTGSDVDVIVFGLDKIPSSWRFLISRDYCDVYYVKTISYEGNSHVVEAIVVKNDELSRKVMNESIKDKELIVKN